MLDRHIEYAKMAEVESRHWWYQSLHHSVAKAIERYFGTTRDIAILDAGCGTGGLLRFLRDRGYRQLSGVDLSPVALEFCRSQNLECSLSDLRELDQHAAAGSLDVITMNDCLYFIPKEEWTTVTDACHRLLRPNGLLILNIPALDCFRGMHDLAVGMNYRVSRADIARMCRAEKFSLAYDTYWPFLLAPLIYVARALQRVKLAWFPRSRIQSDVSLPHPVTNALFQSMTSLERRLLRARPWGSSLFLVFRKRP